MWVGVREGFAHEGHLSTGLSDGAPADEHRKGTAGRREGKCHSLEAGVKGWLWGVSDEMDRGLSDWSQ